MSAITIHTIQARDNVMLEVMTDYFGLNPQQVFAELRTRAVQTSEILGSKDIQYSALRSALVPQHDRREIALVFDTEQIPTVAYGRAIATQIIPLFGKQSSHSILGGDYRGENALQEKLYTALTEELCPAAGPMLRDVTFRNSSQFFLVYINNLTDGMVNRFHNQLSTYGPYVGYADLSFSSFLKTYVSTILNNAYIIHKQNVITPHEDDVSNTKDEDHGYPFASNGFRVRSLQQTFFDLLLSYKIERPAMTRYERDTHFSLNAITRQPKLFDDFEVVVDPKKMDHFRSEKSGSLKRLDLLDVTREELETRIVEKLQSNYIYSMRRDDVHDALMFNVMVEMAPSTSSRRHKLIVGLKYIPGVKELRVITLF